jgi:prepilin-type processing-associated H-X9-DG protein
MFDQNRSVTLGDVLDGASNTIALGEGATGRGWPLCHGAGCTTPLKDANDDPMLAEQGWIISAINTSDYVAGSLLAASLFGCTLEQMNKRPVTDTSIHLQRLGDCRSSALGGAHSVSNFRSEHTGGGHFLFADGSVHFLDKSINRAVYQGASTIQGGEVGTLQ